jgi:hypothetical protein
MSSIAMQSIVMQATDPISNVEQMVEAFGQVVSYGDPLSIVAFVVGAVLTGIAVGSFGLLTLGAVFSDVGRLVSQEPPREGGTH